MDKGSSRAVTTDRPGTARPTPISSTISTRAISRSRCRIGDSIHLRADRSAFQRRAASRFRNDRLAAISVRANRRGTSTAIENGVRMRLGIVTDAHLCPPGTPPDGCHNPYAYERAAFMLSEALADHRADRIDALAVLGDMTNGGDSGRWFRPWRFWLQWMFRS